LLRIQKQFSSLLLFIFVFVVVLLFLLLYIYIMFINQIVSLLSLGSRICLYLCICVNVFIFGCNCPYYLCMDVEDNR